MIRMNGGWRVYLYEFLDDAYPVRIFGDQHKVIEDLVEYKLAFWLVREGAKDLLDNMGTLEVLRQLDNMSLKSLSDKLLFPWAVDQVEHELDRMSTFLVTTDLNEVVLDYS